MQKWLGLPLDASAHGPQLDFLTGIVHILMAVLFVGWGAFFLYTLLRFRKGRNPVASYEGTKSHFSTYGEAGIAVIEIVLLLAFAIPIWASRVGDLPDESESTVVHVVAEQFAWNAHYPGPDGLFGRRDTKLINAATNPLGLDRTDPVGQDDITTINQLHLPVDKPAIIHLSTKDVIHSFGLPVMRVKQDAIPGMVIPVWFEPVKTGSWEIACAQLCGASHYRMRGFFTVHSQADFAKWLTDNAPKAAPNAAVPVAAPAPAVPATPVDTAPAPAAAAGGH